MKWSETRDWVFYLHTWSCSEPSAPLMTLILDVDRVCSGGPQNPPLLSACFSVARDLSGSSKHALFIPEKLLEQCLLTTFCPRATWHQCAIDQASRGSSCAHAKNRTFLEGTSHFCTLLFSVGLWLWCSGGAHHPWPQLLDLVVPWLIHAKGCPCPWDTPDHIPDPSLSTSWNSSPK